MSDGVINPLLLLHHSQLVTWASCDKNCSPSISHLFSTSRLNNSDIDMPRLFSPSLNFYIKKTNIKIGCQVFCLSSKVHLDWYKWIHHGRWVVRSFFFLFSFFYKKSVLSDELILSKRSTRNLFKSYHSSYIDGSLHNEGSFFLLLDSNGKQNTWHNNIKEYIWQKRMHVICD